MDLVKENIAFNRKIFSSQKAGAKICSPMGSFSFERPLILLLFLDKWVRNFQSFTHLLYEDIIYFSMPWYRFPNSIINILD